MCDHSNESYWTLFIMLFKVVLTFESVDEILTEVWLFKMKATEPYMYVVVFVCYYFTK